MVNFGSGRTKEQVLVELETYVPLVTLVALVTPGCWLVVEDENLNGHPVEGDHDPGSAEAIAAFLECNSAFVPDANRETFSADVQPGRISVETGAGDGL